eukprot:921140-Rhodomonas_salina.2
MWARGFKLPGYPGTHGYSRADLTMPMVVPGYLYKKVPGSFSNVLTERAGLDLIGTSCTIMISRGSARATSASDLIVDTDS